ncbi:MAG: hypothetical protein V4525_11890 [Pseudomonadota bacterium]
MKNNACGHANACLTCKHFRADSQDIKLKELETTGRKRLFEITDVRLKKNKEVVSSIENIISAIENDGLYKGNDSKFTKVSLTHE